MQSGAAHTEIIDTDVTRLMLVGTFVYDHSFIGGTVKRHVYPHRDPGSFWVVETFPSVIAGVVYEVRDDGLYTFGAAMLEQPTEKPPENYDGGSPILTVPTRVRVGETVVMAEGPATEEAARFELTARRETWRSKVCTVITSEADSGESAEQWWCEGTGLVKQRFLHPDAGVMELMETKP